MFDFARITLAVPDVQVGNVEFNKNEILKYCAATENDGRFVLFPELCLTGYTCADLFFQDTLLKNTANALCEIIEFSEKSDNIFIVGAPLCVYGQLYNCGIVICDGEISGIIPKTFLPNHNEFYEKRWFSSCADADFEQINFSDIIPINDSDDDYEIAFGNNIVFTLKDGTKFGVEICEDLWTPLPPSTFLTLGGAEIIFNLSASNETIAKHEYRSDLVKQQSARSFCVYAYCSAGTGESTTDLVFSGNSLVAENGTMVAQNEEFLQTDYSITCDVDLGKIRADRMKHKSFKDAVALYGDGDINTVYIQKKTDSNGDFVYVNKLPFVPNSKKQRKQRCLNIFDMQVAGLAKRCVVTNSKLVVGVSGGLDSTLALLVAVKTMQKLGRDVKDVIGITMPGFGTTDQTHTNSVDLMNELGVTSKEIPIANACLVHFDDIGHDKNDRSVTYENVQARERTQILMDYANKIGALVVGTGDLSELALGWCTYNADHMSMYAVNVSIPKTLVRWMIESVAQSQMFANCKETLMSILDTPISPELLPPDENGKITQKTEERVGPYALHDFFLYYMLRYGFSPSKIKFLAIKAFKDDFTKDEIVKWLKVFYNRFFSQQFKRSCLPDGIKVGSICLSPRGDWRMPSDANAKIWLDEISRS